MMTLYFFKSNREFGLSLSLSVSLLLLFSVQCTVYSASGGSKKYCTLYTVHI